MAKSKIKKMRKLTASRKKSAKHMNDILRRQRQSLIDSQKDCYKSSTVRISTTSANELEISQTTEDNKDSQELQQIKQALKRKHPEMFLDNDKDSLLENNAEKKITVEIPQATEITSSNVSKAKHMDLIENNIILPPIKTERVDEDFPEIPLVSITISKTACRLCLNEPTERPTYIWNNESNYKLRIYSLCGIVVSECDFLSSLCSHCDEKLNDFVKFRKQCIDNNKIIEKIQRKKQTALSKHNSEIKDEPTYDVEFDVLLEDASDSGITSKEVDPEQTEYLFEIDPRDDDSDIEIDQEIVFNNADDYYFALGNQEDLLEGKTIILECEKCPVRCEGKKDIDEHIMSHIELPKNYDCSVEGCQKKFVSYENVMLHLKKIHNQEVPRRCRKKLCQYCGQLRKGMAHINAKEGIRRKPPNRSKKYKKCPVCENMVLDLGRHMRKCHSEDTKSVCKFCDKVFSDWYNLRSHMRTHTGEKPFSCPDCEAVFRHNVTMKFHRLKVHNVNMFQRPAEEVLASVSKKPERKRKKNKRKSTKSADEEQ